MSVRRWFVGVSALLLLAGCASGNGPAASNTVTLYTCVSDPTAQAVIKQFEKTHQGTKIELYRAPTGTLNARVEGDVRSGGLRADVIWACDPLTMQDYVDQGLVGGWVPETEIAAGWRTVDYVGVAVLYVVAVAGKGVEAPTAWSDLTEPRYSGALAVPDPSFAASALGALGYFSQNAAFGQEFYAKLKQNGAKQVGTPDDVVNGVAEGTYRAGIAIANSAYAAQKAGSPIQIAWPRPGAIAVYGPIAMARKTKHPDVAKEFISYLAGADGQRAIGAAGSYPTLKGVNGPTQPAGAPTVTPDWLAIGKQKSELLAHYHRVFGG